MTNKFGPLKYALVNLSKKAENVEVACLEFGEAKAMLQLEIYKLIKSDINPEEIATFMAEQELTKEKTEQKKSKFFVTKHEDSE